jgi:hypothetical protein
VVAAVRARRSRAESDPRENTHRTRQLHERRGVAERGPADDGAHHRLEVHERARHVSGNVSLAQGEQPERQQGPPQRQRRKRQHGSGLRVGWRRTLRHDRERKGQERAGGELHRRHRRGIAPGEELGLEHDEGCRQDHGGQDEQIPRRGCAACTGSRDQRDAGERERITAPVACADQRAAARRREQRH